MANYRKSFNFRNGVQVDDDNLVVNANGLVGIGTTVPTEILDVRGTTKVVGLVTATSLNSETLNVSGVGTFGTITDGSVTISAGIITAVSGVVTFYGDGVNLLNLPTSQWIDIDVGLGFTSIYAAGNVGVATTDPRNAFQVGGNPYTSGSGIGFNSTGGLRASGIITASSFSGNVPATNLTGTIENARYGTNLQISGIVTATTFSGALTGTATTASSLTGTPDITVGSVTATNVSSTNVSASGISTVTQEFNVGAGGTVLTALQSGSVGIGTAVPTSALQIRKSSGSLLEVVSDSGQARISVGQVTGVGNSTGVLRFGNASKTLDLINRDTGNLNFVLHGGSAGINTGRFDWLYGQDIVTPRMSLTYGGRLGLGVTNPTNTLHVVGTSTVTSTAYFGGDVRSKRVYFTELLDGVVKTNTNVTSGISTFNRIYLNGGDNILAIGTDNPGAYKFNINSGLDAYLGTRSVLGTSATEDGTFFASNLDADASQLKVFGNSYVGSNFYVRTAATVGSGSTTVEVGSGIVTATDGFTSGTGSPVQISVSGSTLTFSVGGLSTSLTLS